MTPKADNQAEVTSSMSKQLVDIQIQYQALAKQYQSTKDETVLKQMIALKTESFQLKQAASKTTDNTYFNPLLKTIKSFDNKIDGIKKSPKTEKQ